MNTAMAVKAEHVIAIAPELCRESPLQYRKKLGDLTEMIASAREKGILEPLSGRYVGKEIELIFGHRRRAAAIAAGVPEVLVVMREATDEEVIELQLVENIERKDPHPLDEALAYESLLKRGRTLQQVADRIGRPTSYVAQRLKLCGLSKACQKALDEERITLGVAIELAKLPTQTLQDKALQLTATEGDERFDAGRGLMSVADARKEIESEVMRLLKDAPFDQGNPALVPLAGACANCPKRTGTQAELFAAASSPDLCTDPGCFATKVDAAYDVRVRTHKAAGGEVLSKKDTNLFFKGYTQEAHAVRSAYKKLDDHEYVGGKRKTVRQLLGKDLPPTVLTRDPETGFPIDLVPARDVSAAIRKAAPAATSAATSGPSAAEKRKKAEQRRAADIRRAVATQLGTTAQEFFADALVEKPMAEILVHAAAESMWSDTIRAVADRRKMPEPPKAKGNNYRSPGVERIKLWAKSQPADVLLSCLLELLVSRDSRNDGETSQKRAIKLLGIDAKKIEATVIAAAKEKPKSKPAAKGGKPKASKRAKAAVVDQEDEIEPATDDDWDDFAAGEDDDEPKPKKPAKKSGGKKKR